MSTSIAPAHQMYQRLVLQHHPAAAVYATQRYLRLHSKIVRGLRKQAA